MGESVIANSSVKVQMQFLHLCLKYEIGHINRGSFWRVQLVGHSDRFNNKSHSTTLKDASEYPMLIREDGCTLFRFPHAEQFIIISRHYRVITDGEPTVSRRSTLET